MKKHLREQVQNDPAFLQDPSAFAGWLSSIGAEKVVKLMDALREKNVQKIIEITNLTEEQMVAAFRLAATRADELAKKYPDLDSLQKDDH